jgi:hypothetical protein
MNYKKQLNVVPTTIKQNLGAAKECDTFQKACLLFRRLEHANDRGTGEHQFDILERHYIDEMGLSSYIENGFHTSRRYERD